MFVSFAIGDGDGFVLSSIKVFLPIFVGLNKPKDNDDENQCQRYSDILDHCLNYNLEIKKKFKNDHLLLSKELL